MNLGRTEIFTNKFSQMVLKPKNNMRLAEVIMYVHWPPFAGKLDQSELEF